MQNARGPFGTFSPENGNSGGNFHAGGLDKDQLDGDLNVKFNEHLQENPFRA